MFGSRTPCVASAGILLACANAAPASPFDSVGKAATDGNSGGKKKGKPKGSTTEGTDSDSTSAGDSDGTTGKPSTNGSTKTTGDDDDDSDGAATVGTETDGSGTDTDGVEVKPLLKCTAAKPVAWFRTDGIEPDGSQRGKNWPSRVGDLVLTQDISTYRPDVVPGDATTNMSDYLVFDGTDDVLSAPFDLLGTDAATLIVRVNDNGGNSGQRGLIEATTDMVNLGVSILHSQSTLSGRVGDATSNPPRVDASAIHNLTISWLNYGVIYDTTANPALQVFVGDFVLDTAVAAGPTPAAPNLLLVGGLAPTGDAWRWSGGMLEAIVYDFAVSEQERKCIDAYLDTRYTL